MKKLDLNNYGVQEMNAEEMRVVEGGNPAIIFYLIVLLLAIGTLTQS
jgi:hypothetical protein